MPTPISIQTGERRPGRYIVTLLCALALFAWGLSASPASAQPIDPNDCGDGVVDPNNNEDCDPVMTLTASMPSAAPRLPV